MPQRTLRIDIEVDDVFVKQIDAQVKARWSQMSKDERAIVSLLVKALNDARQTKTSEFHSASLDAGVDCIVESLRANHNIPVIASVGRSGGYRLPLSRAECQLYMQSEAAVIFRKIERLVLVYRAMAEYGVTKPEGMDSLITLFKVQKLRSLDGQAPSTTKHVRRRG